MNLNFLFFILQVSFISLHYFASILFRVYLFIDLFYREHNIFWLLPFYRLWSRTLPKTRILCYLFCVTCCQPKPWIYFWPYLLHMESYRVSPQNLSGILSITHNTYPRSAFVSNFRLLCSLTKWHLASLSSLYQVRVFWADPSTKIVMKECIMLGITFLEIFEIIII